MSRYINDQNKVVFQIESGTYSNTSGPGIWIGQVTENSLSDEQNLIETHYLGTTSRNYEVMDQGPFDVNGTLTYSPQDMRLMFWAIGSVTDASGANTSTHYASEIDTNVRQNVHTSGILNPPKSWTLEDSKQAVGSGQNFIRTVKGLVPNTTTITATQGEPVTITVDYIGKELDFSSGTTTSVTEETTPRYLWSDTSLELAGSTILTSKEVSLEINHNLEAPHYLNGSRSISTPIPGNRNYTLNVTLDLNAPEAKRLYSTFYKSLGSFNAVFDLNADNRGQTGSQHTIFTMSGCRITSMEIPSTTEGTTESTIEIRPKNLTAIDYTNGAIRSEYAKV